MTDSKLEAAEEVADQLTHKPNTGTMMQNVKRRYKAKPTLSLEEVRRRLRTMQSTYQTKKKRRA